jgi:hypothetical protein
MDCKKFWIIIAVFLAWAGQKTGFDGVNFNQNLSTITPANYGPYSEALIQHIINHNEAGAVDSTAAEILRGNMAQYAALAAGATATQFFDATGNTLFDISSPEQYQPGSEEATLWGELKELWETMNTKFMNANPVGKILSLMQMIGILKCAKWCIDTACNMVAGAIDLGKWSYNMLFYLVRGPLSTTTQGVTGDPNNALAPNQRLNLKGIVHNMIIQMQVINTMTQQNQQTQVKNTLNDILTEIIKNEQIISHPTEPIEKIIAHYKQMYTSEHPFGPSVPSLTYKQQLALLSDEKFIESWKNMQRAVSRTFSNTIKPSDRPWINQALFTLSRGGRKSKRRPYKSKRRKSSKRRRHYKTKKRAYRSTRFRTHR